VYDQLETHGRPLYQTVINASTAFRSVVATESYKRVVILPMNSGEAGDVCKIVLQRALEEELERIERPPFPSPLTPSGQDIDLEALKELDRSLDMYTTYIPIGRERFTCPISFGHDGGMLISTGDENVACFTSTPSAEGEQRLLEEFGQSPRILWDRIDDVGAGDVVASIVTLFNSVSPELVLAEHMEGRERQDRMLSQLASALFVSVLARVGGNFLVRTEGTHLLSLRRDTFARLLDEVARDSIHSARSLAKRLHAPATAELKRWGIRVVTWRPRTVAFPEWTSGAEEESRLSV